MNPWDCLTKHDIEIMQSILCEKKAVLGFDGFVDTLVRPIKNRTVENKPVFFSSISDFCGFLSGRSRGSSSVELMRISEKLGGNMANVAYAMQELGAKPCCFGSLGEQAVDPIFSEVLSKSRLYSVTAPGKCTAYEFPDGKLMFALNDSVNEMDWEMLSSKVGNEILFSEYSNADFSAFLNWSEIPNSLKIWQGVFDIIGDNWKKDALALFDICDCSRRCCDDLKRVLSFISECSRKVDVILSLNGNEFTAVSNCLMGTGVDLLSEKKLLEMLGVSYLVHHTPSFSVLETRDGSFRLNNRKAENLVCSTGSGDSFNAGFCSALISGLPPEKALAIGSICGYLYVSKGKPADCQELKRILS